MRRASPLAQLRLLCSLDIDSRMTVPTALATIKTWVPHRAGMFLWGNASGHVVAACASDPTMHRIAGRFAADYAQEPCDTDHWPGFAGLIERGESLQVDFTQHACSRPRHRVHEELMRPAGLTRLLACPIVARSGASAALVLLRGTHEGPFNGDDTRKLADLLPRLGAALDRRPAAHEFVDDGSPGGLLVVGHEGRLLYACDHGRQLLHLAACPDQLDRGALEQSEVDLLVRAVTRVREAMCFADQPPVSCLELENEWGQFQLRARPLNGVGDAAAPVGISIHRRIPAPLKIAQRIDRFRLSPRLRELALLLGCNLKNETVADHLGLRPSTVAGMVKDLYLQIGVNNRQALRETLLNH